ncbi:MAG: OmpA family protein [Pseudomonadales bacterium]
MKLRQFKIALGMLLIAPALVVADDNIETTAGVTLSGSLGAYMSDRNRDLHDEWFTQFGAGYRFNNGFEIEVLGMRSDIQSESISAGTDVELTGYRGDVTYNFTNSATQPYISAGYGRHTFESDVPGSNWEQKETPWNVGLGVKHFFAPSWNVRAEMRAFTDDDTDLAISVGFQHVFGQSAPVAPVVVAAAVDGDSDGDGVLDSMDACPGTEAGAKVDARGCYIMVSENVAVEMLVEFPFDSSVVGTQFREEVAKVASFMKKYGDTNAVVGGHTDSVGDDAYNQGLSERRAMSVIKILVEELGVDANRIQARGYGESKPIADNSTEEGRQRNRRVTGVVETEVTTRQ